MSCSIVVLPTEGPSLRRFLDFGDSVYRGDAHFRPSPHEKTTKAIEREAFRNKQSLFLAEERGVAVARIIARISPELRNSQGRPYGLIGFFESENRPEACTTLLRRGVDWLRKQGAGTVIGPMDGDTWHRYRINIGPFQEPPFLMEPYNPSYYRDLWENSGFHAVCKYFSKRVDDVSEVLPTMEAHFRSCEGLGYRFRQINMSRFEEELKALFALSCRIFSRNAYYTSIEETDFADLYRPFKSLFDPTLIWFVEDPSGSPIAFGFAIPEFEAAHAVNFKTIGVLPEHRRKGIAGAIAFKIYQRMLEKNLRIANLCLIQEGNPSHELDGGRGKIFREYLLFEHTDHG